jgi:biotin-dependent carboxylase-like uncharacterized protein
MIEIISTSPLATIQDLGRTGYYRDGVGRAGAMDTLALSIGNALLGNDPNAAGVEIPIFPFRLRFDADLDFSVVGADCNATLDGLTLPPDWAMRARAGQMLSLGVPLSGCRAYLCVTGGIDVPVVLGSRSTQLRESFGGHVGRMLQKGDVLRAIGGETDLPAGGLGAMPASTALPLGEPSKIVVRVLPAAEYEAFLPEARERFWQTNWTVTPQSNRAGYRLSGPELQLESKLELRSHGVVPGVIQVPPGGQPIIQLADAATMGGYPKFGTVIEADLWRLAQARPGDLIRFQQTDYAAAVAALDALQRHVDETRAMADRQRNAARRWGR